jgi:hypothetical protein
MRVAEPVVAWMSVQLTSAKWIVEQLAGSAAEAVDGAIAIAVRAVVRLKVIKVDFIIR